MKKFFILIILACVIQAVPALVVYAEESEAVQRVDLDLVPRYTIKPYDNVIIRVWPYEELSLDAQVRPDGTISYPMLGEIMVAGISAGDLGQQIKESLSVYVKEPKVAVNLENVKQQRAYILGEVNRPGQYEIRWGDTVLDLLSRAGGTTDKAKKSRIGIIRAPEGLPMEQTLENGRFQGDVIMVDVADILGKGEFPVEYSIKDGDIIYVPRGGKVDWQKTSSIILTIYRAFSIDDVLD